MTKGFVASIVTVAVLLLAVHLSNPWVVLIAAFVFLWTWFPRWRTKMYRLIEKGVNAVAKRFRNDRCE